MNEKLEAVMEAVCELCHWPHVCDDQTTLDEKCENCPAEKLLRELMEGAGND